MSQLLNSVLLIVKQTKDVVAILTGTAGTRGGEGGGFTVGTSPSQQNVATAVWQHEAKVSEQGVQVHVAATL